MKRNPVPMLWTVLLLAGCTSVPADEDAAVNAPEEPVLLSWHVDAPLTTKGATEVAGYYYHPGVPPIEGIYEPTDFNCVQIVVRGIRIYQIQAVATWQASGVEGHILLYHYFKDSDGPFRDPGHDAGPSPLAHYAGFDSPMAAEWLTFGIHPATGLPLWHGTISEVAVRIDLTYSVDGQASTQREPALDQFLTCSPRHNQLIANHP